MGPVLSVVIPTCNRAASLPGTLAGLQRQSLRGFEVVVVAGPSTDDTDAVLAEFAAVRVVRCPSAQVGLARNLGAEAACGDVLAFIDDDAVPRPDWLERLRRAYDDPAVDAAGGYVWDAVNDRMQWRLCTSTRTGTVDVDASGAPGAYLGRGVDPFLYLPGCNLSVRRSRLASVGGFDEALSSIYEDTDLCLAIVDAGRRIAVCPDALVDHWSAANATRSSDGAVHDPYRLVHSYAVFVGHNRPSGHDVAALVRDYAEHWRATGRWLAERGALDAAGLDRFVARVGEAQARGMIDGGMPRRRRVLAPPDRAAFRDFVRP